MVFLQHEQGNNLSKYKIIGIIMETIYDRTLGLIGDEALDKLKRSRILVFGLGGVGGYLTEALARAGVGNLTLVDFDTVSVSNINRQVLALHSTVGMKKTEVMEKRLLDINPSLNVVTLCQKVDARWIDSFNFDAYDYIGDAIDDVPGKIAIIEKAKAKGIPVISCLGTGGRLDPTKFQITDISKTHTCPLARKMRKELSARGITEVKVLFSSENPSSTHGKLTESVSGKNSADEKMGIPSISFCPSVAGLLIASEIIRYLI